MKKLKFKLEGKEMMNKQQMKEITGGEPVSGQICYDCHCSIDGYSGRYNHVTYDEAWELCHYKCVSLNCQIITHLAYNYCYY